jgi:hypothetical protein
VIDDGDQAVMTITTSRGGREWPIRAPRSEQIEMPLATPLTELTATIVAALERPNET